MSAGITVLGAAVAKCSDYLEVKRKQSGLKQNDVFQLPVLTNEQLQFIIYYLIIIIFIFMKGLEKGMVELDTPIAHRY